MFVISHHHQTLQAYEEKEKLWEKELRKIKGLYDNRLRASQQKSSKMEQALTNQTYQVQMKELTLVALQTHMLLGLNLAQRWARMAFWLQNQDQES